MLLILIIPIYKITYGEMKVNSSTNTYPPTVIIQFKVGKQLSYAVERVNCQIGPIVVHLLSNNGLFKHVSNFVSNLQ